MRPSRWLRFAALGTWTVCGLPAMAAIVRVQPQSTVIVEWSTAYVAFGIALLVAFGYRHSARHVATALVGLQSIAAVVMTYVANRHLDATGVCLLTGVGLLVIVAAQLPHLMSLWVAPCWIAAQTLALSLATARGLSLADVVTFGLGSAGFQVFACLTTLLMLREAEAREGLARANTELHATRALLAEHSRAGERLRIARDLHDTIGHHLTALSLQLDVASRLAQAPAESHVNQAHAITRLLLAEVRTVVGEMRDAGRPDLAEAIRALAASNEALRIHVDIPDGLAVDHPAQVRSLVRCVQEIITNTSKHANASNLWIRIRAAAGGIELFARDDGKGADVVRCGNGLTGMRERFAEHAGRLEFGAAAGRGFEIQGFMPIERVVS